MDGPGRAARAAVQQKVARLRRQVTRGLDDLRTFRAKCPRQASVDAALVQRAERGLLDVLDKLARLERVVGPPSGLEQIARGEINIGEDELTSIIAVAIADEISRRA